MKKIMFDDHIMLTEKVKTGQKTKTRRLITNKLLIKYGVNKHTLKDKIEDLIFKAPYKKGEIIAVAEQYRDCLDHIATLPEFEYYSRAELEAKFQEEKGWDNKMYVKPEYMPTKIQITDVKIERIQSISDEDCLEEGIKYYPYTNRYGYEYKKDEWRTISYQYRTLQEAFKSLIKRLKGGDLWEQNPLIYVYTFKRVEL